MSPLDPHRYLIPQPVAVLDATLQAGQADAPRRVGGAGPRAGSPAPRPAASERK